MEIEFNVTTEEILLVGSIVTKWIKVLDSRAIKTQSIDRMTMNMDLCACHSNGTPLDFEKLAEFNAQDFAHDMSGISCNINRDNGKLENEFLPRCAK